MRDRVLFVLLVTAMLYVEVAFLQGSGPMTTAEQIAANEGLD